MALAFDFKQLNFNSLSPVKFAAPVTARGRKGTKGGQTLHFTVLKSALSELADEKLDLAFNEDHNIFRFTPSPNGLFQFSLSNLGRKSGTGELRMLVNVPYPSTLEFSDVKVACGYELRAGEFYIKYPKAHKDNAALNAPVRLTPVENRKY